MVAELFTSWQGVCVHGQCHECSGVGRSLICFLCGAGPSSASQALSPERELGVLVMIRGEVVIMIVGSRLKRGSTMKTAMCGSCSGACALVCLMPCVRTTAVGGYMAVGEQVLGCKAFKSFAEGPINV